MSEFFAGWVASDSAKQDSINLKRIYVDINDGNLYDGVLFSQIMYWHGPKRGGGNRLRIEKNGHLWLAKRYEDWQEECRINAATARKSIARMIKRGLLIKKNFHFNGKPTVHIRVNESGFEAAVKAFLSVTRGQIDSVSNSPERTDVYDTRGQMEGGLSVTRGQMHITETTLSETTTKKKKKDSTAPAAAVAGAEEQKPQPKPRKRDLIFDIIAEKSFGIKDTAGLDKKTGARIGKIKKFLTAGYPEHDAEKVAKFYDWYEMDAKGAAAPKDDGKFGEWYTKWLQGGANTNTPIYHRLVKESDLPPEVPVEERRRILAAYKNDRLKQAELDEAV